MIAANKVTVTYTDRTPDDDLGVIEDAPGNDAASFTVEMVTNTVARDLPGAPTGLTATTTTGRDVTLDWTAPSDTGTGAITGYQIEVSTDSAVSWEVAKTNTGSTTTSYKHEGLIPGTRYDYRVSAINADGAGTASSSINTTTVAVPTISSIALSDPDLDGDTGCHANSTYISETPTGTSSRNSIEITITFSGAVDVMTPTTDKAIAIEIGDSIKLATYASGTGTTTLVYNYQVEKGLQDRDGISLPANPLRGGGIVTKDKGEGFEADLSHSGIADDSGQKVDSIRPTLIRAEAAANHETFTLVFTEPMCAAKVTFYLDVGDASAITWAVEATELTGCRIHSQIQFPIAIGSPNHGTGEIWRQRGPRRSRGPGRKHPHQPADDGNNILCAFHRPQRSSKPRSAARRRTRDAHLGRPGERRRADHRLLRLPLPGGRRDGLDRLGGSPQTAVPAR